MKIIYYLLFTLSIGFSAKAQQEPFYEITGDVKNLPATKVYLVTFIRGKNNNLSQPIINSALVKDGKFRLYKDTVLMEPSWATEIFYLDKSTKKRKSLSYQNKYNPKVNRQSFLLENRKIEISGDMNTGLILSGSPESDMLFRYGLLSSGLYGMDAKIDSVKKLGDNNKLTQILKFKNDSLAIFKKKLLNIASQNPSSWVALLNIYQNADIFAPAELEQACKIFSKEVMSTPKGISLSNYQKQSGSLTVGALFPSFSFKDVNQKLVSLNEVRGVNGTLVIFWASWCGPCRKEIPELKKIYSEYNNKGINFISISTDHDLEAWKKAVRVEAMPWPNLSNLPGNKDEIYKRYNVNEIPAVFLLDSKNRIVMPNDYRISEIRDNLRKVVK